MWHFNEKTVVELNDDIELERITGFELLPELDEAIDRHDERAKATANFELDFNVFKINDPECPVDDRIIRSIKRVAKLNVKSFKCTDKVFVAEPEVEANYTPIYAVEDLGSSGKGYLVFQAYRHHTNGVPTKYINIHLWHSQPRAHHNWHGIIEELRQEFAGFLSMRRRSTQEQQLEAKKALHEGWLFNERGDRSEKRIWRCQLDTTIAPIAPMILSLLQFHRRSTLKFLDDGSLDRPALLNRYRAIKGRIVTRHGLARGAQPEESSDEED